MRPNQSAESTAQHTEMTIVHGQRRHINPTKDCFYYCPNVLRITLLVHTNHRYGYQLGVGSRRLQSSQWFLVLIACLQ